MSFTYHICYHGDITICTDFSQPLRTFYWCAFLHRVILSTLLLSPLFRPTGSHPNKIHTLKCERHISPAWRVVMFMFTLVCNSASSPLFQIEAEGSLFLYEFCLFHASICVAIYDQHINFVTDYNSIMHFFGIQMVSYWL